MYLKNSKIIVIKIGSSLLVDDKKKIRKKWLQSFAKDIQKLIEDKFIRPPEHLFYFNKSSIKQLFLSKGFDKIKFMLSLKPTIKMLGFKI